MKKRFLTVAVGLMLASASLTFAASQATPTHPYNTPEAQDRTGITRAVQQGKGTGMTRNEGLRANAYRSETPDNSRTIRDTSRPASPNWSDTAYRK